jgi:hypothetical protein
LRFDNKILLKEKLPTGLTHARNLAGIGELSKTDAAQTETTEKTVHASALPTSTHYASGKFRGAVGFGDL